MDRAGPNPNATFGGQIQRRLARIFILSPSLIHILGIWAQNIQDTMLVTTRPSPTVYVDRSPARRRIGIIVPARRSRDNESAPEFRDHRPLFEMSPPRGYVTLQDARLVFSYTDASFSRNHNNPCILESNGKLEDHHDPTWPLIYHFPRWSSRNARAPGKMIGRLYYMFLLLIAHFVPHSYQFHAQHVRISMFAGTRGRRAKVCGESPARLVITSSGPIRTR